MNSCVECIGFDASRLTKSDIQKVNTFIESQPPGDVLKVQLFPNFDATSDENIPSGMNVIFSPDAKVDATLLSDNLFQTFAVSKIIPQEGQVLNDESFANMGPELIDAVRQFPEKPISGKVHNRHNNQEIAAWSPELGGPGSFVGVYSKLRDDHRTKDYFIVARGTAPLYVQDVKKKISTAKETPTFAELMNKEEWCDFMGAAEEAARRNVFRSMMNAAEACGVEIMRADDVLNGAPYQNMELAYPEMGVPEWEQPTHTIQKVQFDRKPAVAITYGVVPIESCLRLEDGHYFVIANPYDGISVFNMSKQAEMAQYTGLPADTGRANAPETISTEIGEYTNRTHGIVWEKSIKPVLVGDAHHVDLHPAAFREVDKNFKNSMRTMGWNPEDHVERMVCVVAKIYNPEIRRQ